MENTKLKIPSSRSSFGQGLDITNKGMIKIENIAKKEYGKKDNIAQKVNMAKKIILRKSEYRKKENIVQK